MTREPFDPPYTAEDVPQFDEIYGRLGFSGYWLNSSVRANLLEKRAPKQMDPQTKAKNLIQKYISNSLDKTEGPRPTHYELNIVWFNYTLHNWKALVMTRSVSDDMYYEVTYNWAKKETYIDAYKKYENICIPDDPE